MRQLKDIFNAWAANVPRLYTHQQWLLSKWEMLEGVEWSEEKIKILLKTIQEGLQLKPSDTLIDLGCGGGWIIERLASSVKIISGLDISMNMLAHAGAISPKKIFVCGETGRLPYPSAVCSKALCYYVFMNFIDDQYIENSILEITRILKKGGKALIGQLADKNGSREYDAFKADYLMHCRTASPKVKNTEDLLAPPLKLYDRNQLENFLKHQKIAFELKDAFNPFYYPGQPSTISWRFDLVITKK